MAGVGAAAFVGTAVLLPVLVAAFGPRLAVPILTVAQLVGNGNRVWFNRRLVDYRVVGVIDLTMLVAGLLFLIRG